jgi:hypothetical protein
VAATRLYYLAISPSIDPWAIRLSCSHKVWLACKHLKVRFHRVGALLVAWHWHCEYPTGSRAHVRPTLLKRAGGLTGGRRAAAPGRRGSRRPIGGAPVSRSEWQCHWPTVQEQQYEPQLAVLVRSAPSLAVARTVKLASGTWQMGRLGSSGAWMGFGSSQVGLYHA